MKRKLKEKRENENEIHNSKRETNGKRLEKLNSIIDECKREREEGKKKLEEEKIKKRRIEEEKQREKKMRV